MANSEIVKNKDFVELEFLGRNLFNNEVFDTNILEEARKINPEIKQVRPLNVCIGQEMVVKGLDEFLEGKEVGKKYSLKLTPDKAFGKRDSKLIRLIPMKMFLEQKVYPQPGMTLALDNSLVKVISVSGGRVMVDFNNPLAGKDLEYEFTIKNIISDDKEKINSIQKYFFGQIFEYDLEEAKDGKTKKIVFKDLKLMPILEVFKDKFKDVLGFDVEILEKKAEKTEEKKAEKKEEVKSN
jgi:FKBP-type peptidyl-prolyl cis-trans isomerase SlyD